VLKAILQNGAIVPLEALPPNWKEGTILHVENPNPTELNIDEWAAKMNELCADSTAEDQRVMEEAIAQHRAASKPSC
jgi:hypothetical protein